MNIGTWIVLGAAALATAIALIERHRRGRFRTSDEYIEWSRRLGTSLGSEATFVQFSSAFCAPCRATRLILSDIASKESGIKHIEIDAESHLELVRELNILATPTTIVLGRDGRTVARSSGAPRRDQVLLLLQGIRNSQSEK